MIYSSQCENEAPCGVLIDSLARILGPDAFEGYVRIGPVVFRFQIGCEFPEAVLKSLRPRSVEKNHGLGLSCNGIALVSAIERNQPVSAGILAVKEAGKNLDGIGPLLVDIVSAVASDCIENPEFQCCK